MWRDIVLANRESLANVLGEFINEMKAFREALDAGEPAAVEAFFEKARQRRETWCGGKSRSTPE